MHNTVTDAVERIEMGGTLVDTGALENVLLRIFATNALRILRASAFPAHFMAYYETSHSFYLQRQLVPLLK